VAEGAIPRAVGLLGAGVIGAGWAARFALHGANVRLYDPDPRTEENVRAAVENARRAYAVLMTVPLPPEGELTVTASPEEAARGAEFVQESVPEREALKRDLIAAAGSVTPAGVVIASSTSGLLPSRLQEGVPHPERVVVGHPFHPVYLLPLVEVCGGAESSPAAVEQAESVYRAVGMSPLRVRKEIDGFVADRLLEALWREALWLVADGVATVGEIDDAIRLGAGLRWSFMGTFLAYRMAGGDAGMRGFLEHFGPALEWPWTKLVDVPELTGELVDRIATQSDAQAAGRSLRELERERDACLVAVLQALRAQSAGAGEVLAAHEARLRQA
jgi:carnitine 3-dehydrogenase